MQKRIGTHKNVIALLASEERAGSGRFTEFLMLMEYCAGLPASFACMLLCVEVGTSWTL